MLISPYISIVTLNVNKLNSPVKRHRIVVWEEKKHRLKVKIWGKIVHVSETEREHEEL